jgi:hypothetical protein
MAAHVGDIGTEIIFDTGEDLSTATVHILLYRKPSGLAGEWAGTVVGTTLKFITTLITDLDIAGVWQGQAYCETPTWKRHSDTDTFAVLPNIR